MATPFESAQLNLQLFDLRREPVLREARQWFTFEFPDAEKILVRRRKALRGAAMAKRKPATHSKR